MTGEVWIWFKRDLRVHDHPALHAAVAQAAAGGHRLRAVLLLEPAWLASPEFDAQHAAFWRDSASELATALAARGIALHGHAGPAVPVFEALRAAATGTVHALHSHEETGPGWTWDRDRAVAAWCRAHGIAWHEHPQTGVVRRLRQRNGWAGRWAARMQAPALPPPGPVASVPAAGESPAALLARAGGAALAAAAPRDPVWAVPGEAAAQQVLHDFLQHRGADYRRAISSPLTAETGCSRLSAHLAFGTVSMRQVHQATEARIAATAASADPAERRAAHALRGFAGRLRWHCHFMQKLEDEPAIERRNFSRATDGLRPGDTGCDWDDDAQARFTAWCEGRTGVPMVDACMRQLRATGWLNFRMRAMLVSFAAYPLWLHWRQPGLFLARQFLDFEPGIHWSQMQMQSGTTGINTLRIYSPAKQAADHDPDGTYIRRWVPELARVPRSHLATPWKLSEAEQQAIGLRLGSDYPRPVVDEAAAVRRAKDTLYGLRRTAEAKREADAIQARHGSRRSGLPPSGGRRAAPKPRARPAPVSVQPDLFADAPEGTE